MFQNIRTYLEGVYVSLSASSSPTSLLTLLRLVLEILFFFTPLYLGCLGSLKVGVFFLGTTIVQRLPFLIFFSNASANRRGRFFFDAGWFGCLVLFSACSPRGRAFSFRFPVVRLRVILFMMCGSTTWGYGRGVEEERVKVMIRCHHKVAHHDTSHNI